MSSSFLLLLYHSFTFITLFTYGLYHLSLSLLLLKPSSPLLPPRPYHPLPLPSPTFLRHLPLFLLSLSLLLSLSYHLSLSSSSSSTPLSLSSLHTSLSLLLFLLLSLSLFRPFLPHDLTFLLASLSFALLSSSPSPSPPSDLQSLAHSISSALSLSSALFALLLALFPSLHLANVALSLSLSLHGLWSLQTYLSLYLDPFVPEGCHRLLDLPQPATRCILESSRLRAEQILDLALAGHVVLVAVVGMVVYKVCGGGWGGEGGVGGGLGGRRYNGGSYEALPTSSSAGDLDHVQMKAMGKSTAQA